MSTGWLWQKCVLELTCFDYHLCSAAACVQVTDDPPLTEQGLQQAYELGLRLQVLVAAL